MMYIYISESLKDLTILVHLQTLSYNSHMRMENKWLRQKQAQRKELTGESILIMDKTHRPTEL